MRRRRRRRWPRRALWATSAVLWLLACGIAYQALGARADAERYPPPGELVDVGGHRLHLNCAGRGRPIVILEAGLPGSSLDWSLVQPAVAKATTVCAYDRAGFGWSDPGPQARTGSRIADELHTLLERAGVPGPYVVVGHSFGGLYVRVFASRFPKEVAGVVLVDPSAEDLVRRRPPPKLKVVLCETQVLLGVERLEAALGRDREHRKLPPGVKAVALAQDSRTATCRAAYDESSERAETILQVRHAGRLGSRPLVLVARGRDIDPGRGGAQTALLRLSRNSEQVVASESGHYIQLEQPAVVVDAIGKVFAAAGRAS